MKHKGGVLLRPYRAALRRYLKPGTGLRLGPATETPRGNGESVMVVEDEKSLRDLCGLFLGDLGYKVMAAETPGEALQMARKSADSIHLLLTDIVMPGMDGKQLARRILAVRPSVRVLFMSGYTADVIAQGGVLESSVNFLAKPFTRMELAVQVQAVLKDALPEAGGRDQAGTPSLAE